MGPTDIEGGTGGWLLGALGGLSGVWAAIRIMRRQNSEDQTALKRDEADRKRITSQEEEIARLRPIAEAALKDTSATAAKIASLESDNRHLRIENARLMRDIKRAVRGLPDSARSFLETDFSALADVEERIEDGKR